MIYCVYCEEDFYVKEYENYYNGFCYLYLERFKTGNIHFICFVCPEHNEAVLKGYDNIFFDAKNIIKKLSIKEVKKYLILGINFY